MPEGPVEVWEAIAPSYAAARRRPWPLVLEFLESLPRAARVLDVGAGSGRHALAAMERGLEPLALDAARGFLRALPARLKGQAGQGDAAALPVRDASCDAVLLVAVLGTMPRREERVMALREARRVLKPGGRLMLTVWARWQPKYVRALLGLGPWRRTGPGEVLAPWPMGGARVERPYYLYTKRALLRELRAAGWEQVEVRAARLGPGRWPDNLVGEARR